CLRYDSDPYSF
nr:immunoglobulin light chain junction region [Macaca mulatta]